MAAFAALCIPIPSKIRHRTLLLINKPFKLAPVKIGVKSATVFILILFLDSVNRVYKITQELVDSPINKYGMGFSVERSDIQARRFYAQRNMYLCGFTLFLSVILNRVYNILLDLIVAQTQLKNGIVNTYTTGSASNSTTDSAEILELQDELAKKDLELKAFKKQSKGFSDVYDRTDKAADVKSRLRSNKKSD